MNLNKSHKPAGVIKLFIGLTILFIVSIGIYLKIRTNFLAKNKSELIEQIKEYSQKIDSLESRQDSLQKLMNYYLKK